MHTATSISFTTELSATSEILTERPGQVRLLDQVQNLRERSQPNSSLFEKELMSEYLTGNEVL